MNLVETILLEAAADSDKILRKAIDDHFLDFTQSKYKASERKTFWYQYNYTIIYKLCRHMPFEKAMEVYDAVRRYTTTNYGRMNNSLRSGKSPKNVDLIDLYFKYTPTKIKQDFVFRGIDKEFYDTLKIGKVFTDPAYVSTTTDLGVAVNFSKRRKVGIVLKILGVKGLAVSLPASYGNESVEDGEAEYLLPRNLKFKVIGIEEADKATNRVKKLIVQVI